MSAGHSEIGTLSVYALLVVLAVQVATGVFTNDGSFTEGPWVKFVSEALSNRLSRIHYYNHWLIVGLTRCTWLRSRITCSLAKKTC